MTATAAVRAIEAVDGIHDADYQVFQNEGDALNWLTTGSSIIEAAPYINAEYQVKGNT
jgi:hypothetical protein